MVLVQQMQNKKASLESFISPTDLPMPDDWVLPVHVIDQINTLIKEHWNGWSAEIPDYELLQIDKRNTAGIIRRMGIYAAKRGWYVTFHDNGYPSNGKYYKFTPK